MEPTDADLWARSRTGDREAFGLLFERHAKAIYNYCFRRVGVWATAEDMLSMVLLEAWRRRNKELPPDKIRPWLFGIATNVVRNQLRSERRSLRAFHRTPRPEPEPDFAAASDAHMDDEPRARMVVELLSQLPQREQDVYVLCVGMELSYEDAALALELPVGTVRSRLSRARARLREFNPGIGHEAGERATVQEAHKP
jgi:RNA polymerase sigma-70 factor (ECF subfamily)